jgi:hypothetical protein
LELVEIRPLNQLVDLGVKHRYLHLVGFLLKQEQLLLSSASSNQPKELVFLDKQNPLVSGQLKLPLSSASQPSSRLHLYLELNKLSKQRHSDKQAHLFLDKHRQLGSQVYLVNNSNKLLLFLVGRLSKLLLSSVKQEVRLDSHLFLDNLNLSPLLSVKLSLKHLYSGLKLSKLRLFSELPSQQLLYSAQLQQVLPYLDKILKQQLIHSVQIHNLLVLLDNLLPL